MQIIQTPSSSNISRFGWDGTDLYIEFKSNGSVYRYLSVSADVYKDMCETSSVGGFFHARIKKGFDCEPVPVVTARLLGFEEVVSNLG